MCPPVSQLTGEHSKLQPDIYTAEDNQAFDVTIVTTPMNEAYKHKLKKYRETQLAKDVIPIVITPEFKIHDQSAQQMAKYCNMRTLYGEYAYLLSYYETVKIMKYKEHSAESHTEHAEVLLH